MSNYLMSRKNKILAARETQLNLNRLALDGGNPYIAARLWRAPNESDLSWKGDKAQCIAARADRACYVNDAGRIAAKIGQYLFAQAAERSGVDPEWSKDVTADAVGIDQFWQDVSDELTACQWCWLQTDRAAPVTDSTGHVVPRTLADKAADGDFIFWRLWPATSVPDWYIDQQGVLQWLLTHEFSSDASNPFEPPVLVETRTLWQRTPSGVMFRRYVRREGETSVVAEGTVSTSELPFVLVGKPSGKPWWFDSVEQIQAQILNLDSLHIENLVRTVFAQLVIPETMLDSVRTKLIEKIGDDGEKLVEAVREVIRGLDTPLVESAEDKGTTRFIQPSTADLEGIPQETQRKRSLLFDVVGLSLFNKESRQIESAESKQFDHLDTEATLRHRAKQLQNAEERLVALSKELDPDWADYSPKWPMKFDVTDIQGDSAALAQITGVSNLTLTQRKVVLRIVTRLMQSLVTLSEDEVTAIGKEIDALKEEDFSFFPALPAATDGDTGE